MEASIKKHPEALKVELESTDQVWDNFKEQYFQSDLEGTEIENLFSNGIYHVYVNLLDKLPDLVRYIQGLDHVREVNYPENTQ